MKMNQWLVAVAAAALCLGAGELLAQNNNGSNNNSNGNGRQGRRGPLTQDQIQQFRQASMDRYKEQLEITDDSEWNAIQPLVQKVMDARMAMMPYAGFGRGFMGRGRGGSDNGGRPAFGGAFGTPSPDARPRILR
jgi:hypothetical protein